MAVLDLKITVPSLQSSVQGQRDICIRLLSSQLDGNLTDAQDIVVSASIAVSQGRLLLEEACRQLGTYLARSASGMVLDENDKALRELARKYFLVRHEEAKYTRVNPTAPQITKRGNDDAPYAYVFRVLQNSLALLNQKINGTIGLKLYGQHFMRKDSEVAPEGHSAGYVKKKWTDATQKSRAEGGQIHLNFNSFANLLAPKHSHEKRRARLEMTRTFIHEATHKYFHTDDAFYITQQANTKIRYWQKNFDVGPDQIGDPKSKVLNTKRALRNADAIAHFVGAMSIAQTFDGNWIASDRVDRALATCKQLASTFNGDAPNTVLKQTVEGFDVELSAASQRWQ